MSGTVMNCRYIPRNEIRYSLATGRAIGLLSGVPIAFASLGSS